MVGISKRQQLRNERALQDLIRSVPGNDRCADCSAMNPGWASWSIGIFLCVRCAALHRKMGTHISKVKSLSMDSWSSEQVDNMKSHGNTIMNKLYNPRNVRPPVPTDIDEADACMERFIRQKYQTQTLEDGKPKPPSRHDSGYTRSPEGSPPPLPPKPSRPFGFGLRSASATNLNRQITGNRGRGSPVGDIDGPSALESKLATLRDMGFHNERRNATVLRGLDGNLEKSIETLVRLGEGNQPSSRAKTPAQAAQDTSTSPNPFDQLDKQAAQSNGNSYNPFDVPTPKPQAPAQLVSTQPLEATFQNLQVSQPLFPHSTGGYPTGQTYSQPFFPQAAAPAPFTSVYGGYASSPQSFNGGNNPFFQTGAQPQASLSTPSSNQNSPFPQTNPFFSQAPPQLSGTPLNNQSMAASTMSGPTFPHPPRHANTMPTLSTTPFGQAPLFQQPQPQPQPQPQLRLQAIQPGQGPFNPFQSMTAPATPQSAGYPTQAPFGYLPTQQLMAQPTGRLDKTSILSLYGLSPPTSATPEQQQFQTPTVASSIPGTTAPFGTLSQQQPSNLSGFEHANQQSTINSHLTASRNPFLSVTGPGVQGAVPAPNQPLGFSMPGNLTTPGANVGFMRGHMSQQSVDVSGFQNGRHSPDAFASLSARHG